jgi:hypothetical protein
MGKKLLFNMAKCAYSRNMAANAASELSESSSLAAAGRNLFRLKF